MTTSFVDQYKQSQKNNYASRKDSTKALFHLPLSTLYSHMNKELMCHINYLVAMPCQLGAQGLGLLSYLSFTILILEPQNMAK